MTTFCRVFPVALVLLFADLALSDNYAIVIDTSENMRGDRLTAVRQALMSFVLDASAGTHVTIIGFGNKAKRFSQLVDLSSTENKNRVLASLPKPEDLEGSTSSPAIGIRKALGTLKKAARTYQIVVVITASQETAVPYIRETRLVVKADKLKAVVYGVAIGEQAEGDDLMALCKQTKGMMFYESETAGEPYTIVDALIRITQEFDRGNLSEIYTGMFTLPLADRWTQDVIIDPSVGLDTVFYISWMGSSSADADTLEFTLLTPSGKTVVPGSREYGYSSAFNMSQYNIPDQAESGKWTMQVTNRMSTNPISVSALVLSRSIDNKPLWISTKVQTGTKYPYIWAEVRKGNEHIRGAHVVAKVTRPNMPPITIRLQEHRAGTHNPASDGVYGASFTFFSGDGRYNVHVTVRGRSGNQHRQQESEVSEQKGHSSLAGRQTGVSNFVRMQTPGMFVATGVSSTDTIPPNTVRDLIVVDRTLPCGIVTLQWTAPGDDFTNGRAFRYDIRMSTSIFGLMLNFSMQPAVRADEILSESPSSLGSPKESRTVEKLIFRCRICTSGTPVFFSLKSVDDYNNWSHETHPAGAFGMMSADASNCAVESRSQTKPSHRPTASDDVQETTPVPGMSRVEPMPDDLLHPPVQVVSEVPVPTSALSESNATEPPKSGGSFNQPLPQCNCRRLKIKDHVCRDDVVYSGKLVRMVLRNGQQELEFDDVTLYRKQAPDGISLTRRVLVMQQCPVCKTMKLNRYYSVSAVLNRVDEKFYIYDNSMARQMSQVPSKYEDAINRIKDALKKCP